MAWQNRASVRMLTSTMIAVTQLVMILISAKQCVAGQDVNGANSAPEVSPAGLDDGALTLTFDVMRADGMPVLNAIVQTTDLNPAQRKIARTNSSGRAEIRDRFEQDAKISARSDDGKFQATFFKPAHEIRKDSVVPIKLVVTPAVEHRVIVTCEGRPAVNVQVIGRGELFTAEQWTDADGVAVLNRPADDALTVVTAWDERRGLSASGFVDGTPKEGSTSLSLLTPAPMQFRFVDQHDAPASGVEFGLGIQLDEANWVLPSALPGVGWRTDLGGEANIVWLPRDRLRRVAVQLRGHQWGMDTVDLNQIHKRLITVHVRRLKPVVGRVQIPDGRNPEGLLINGFGFGTTANGKPVYSRVRRNGFFTLHAASDHGYAMGIADEEWASDIWTGCILRDDDAKAQQITMTAYPATPVSILATWGTERGSVANAKIFVRHSATFQWTDSTGMSRNCSGGVRKSLKTDAAGRAYVGVGRGTVGLTLNADKWSDDQIREVKSLEPIEIRFHRAAAKR